jgi:putative ABC transport system permease protein
MATADRELTAAMREIGDANGMASISLGGKAVPMRDQAVATVRSGLLLLFAAVALVLIIACANVSNLLLAQIAGRQREMAIRASLGAGRWRIVRQLVTENVILALAGGALGIALAVWGKEWLLSLVPASLPRLADIAIDARVLATALAIALIAGIVFGIIAAMHATRTGPAIALRSGAVAIGGKGHARFRQALVVAELAISLVLLAGAAALVHSFVRIQRVSPGFETRGVLASQVLVPSTTGLSFREEGPRWAAVFTQYLERVRTIPGVEAAGAVSSLPLSGAWESTTYSIVGQQALPEGARPEAHYSVASPEYFRVMGIPLREGRSLAATDISTSLPVVVVSRSLAEKSWPGASAVGKRIRLFSDQPMEVVGVVEDVREASLIAPVEPTIYIPLAQFGYPAMSIVMKVAGDPLSVVPAMRRELAAVDPLLPLEEIRTMEAVLDASLAQRRFGMLLLGFFAASALALVVIGLYGVIAYGVAQRTHEIGIRTALGASRGDVLRLILAEGARVTAIGVGIGVLGSFGLSRVLGSMLYGVSAVDPMTLGAVAALLVVTALAASAMPARRAMSVEPVEALRGD